MKLGIPYIVSLRGSDVPFYSKRFFLLDTLILRYLSKRIWKCAYAVIPVSTHLEKLAKQTAPDQKFHIIPNGINTDEFIPIDNNKNHSIYTILFVGRLIPRKGLALLLRAFKMLSKTNSNINLRIVGDGPLRREIEQSCEKNGISENVQVSGYIPHQKMSHVYQNADIFVLPSHAEGMSNVILEAMACGLPIISTDAGATGLIDDNGIIVEKSPEKIASAIESLISNNESRMLMAQKSRSIAEQMSWKQVADQYLELYEKI